MTNIANMRLKPKPFVTNITLFSIICFININFLRKVNSIIIYHVYIIYLYILSKIHCNIGDFDLYLKLTYKYNTIIQCTCIFLQVENQKNQSVLLQNYEG